MTIIEQSTPSSTPTDDTTTADADEFRLVVFDLYRDIHKGIRAELFAASSTAGNVDPSDRVGRLALADHVASIARVLESHAEHEDAVIEPALVEHLPELAASISADHTILEARFAAIDDVARTFADVPAGQSAEQRRLGHLLYLELTGFTSAYLRHQLVEERVVMPALERLIGVDAVVDMHVRIVSSIPPDEMGRSLGFMLPAMNLDDRAEMLDGMRQSAPPEAFVGVVSLARSVLTPADFEALAGRLELA